MNVKMARFCARNRRKNFLKHIRPVESNDENWGLHKTKRIAGRSLSSRHPKVKAVFQAQGIFAMEA
jgi:hypothetical protein